jgi:hypothetical protein
MSGFIVRALRLGISANAASRGSNPYCVKSRQPMRFDYDRPAAWYVDHGNDEPTVFASEQEAKEKTDEFIPRIRAIVRIARDTGRSFDIGHAATLLGHSFGTDTHLGGYHIAPLSEWQVEHDEEARYYAAEAREQVELADAQARAAQEAADKLRGEYQETDWPAEKPKAASGASKWVATSVPKVQRYVRQDGSESFRGRSDNQVSPGFPTIEQAIAWVDGERDVNPVVTDERAAAMEALREVVQR